MSKNGEEYRVGGRVAVIVVIATILMSSLGVLWNTLLSSRIWIFYNPENPHLYTLDFKLASC